MSLFPRVYECLYVSACDTQNNTEKECLAVFGNATRIKRKSKCDNQLT